MKLNFSKMQASGNDFVVIDDVSLPKSRAYLAKKLCDRKFGIGADGVLFFGRRSEARGCDFRFRIYNSDGSHPKMCGNGARCIALYAKKKLRKSRMVFLTDAGVVSASVIGKEIRVGMQKAASFKTNLKLRAAGRNFIVNYAVVGVPHAVIFTDGLDSLDVEKFGRAVRFHRIFSPAGANVDFVKVIGRKKIKIRTYERGVEGETLSCGTGSVASVFTAVRLGLTDGSVTVVPRSGEKLRIDAGKDGNFLTGGAQLVFDGAIEV